MERVKNRLRRATAALERAGIEYAVIDGNAVAAWVSRVDESAARTTQDVELLIRRTDLDRVKDAMSRKGFVYRHAAGIEMFLDGPAAKPREAVQIIFAGEKVRPEYSQLAPDVSESAPLTGMRLLNLDALLRMKLTSFRIKDQTHILDLIGVGLVDAGKLERVPAELAPHLTQLLDNPEA